MDWPLPIRLINIEGCQHNRTAANLERCMLAPGTMKGVMHADKALQNVLESPTVVAICTMAALYTPIFRV